MTQVIARLAMPTWGVGSEHIAGEFTTAVSSCCRDRLRVMLISVFRDVTGYAVIRWHLYLQLGGTTMTVTPTIPSPPMCDMVTAFIVIH